MIRLMLLLTILLLPHSAHAFCGFYVAKADTALFNKASKVILARHKNRTVITMANDYQGEAIDFAIVVPVPVTIKKSQVNITENKIIDHLDAYTAPRLVEYYDRNPCEQPVFYSADPTSNSIGNARSKTKEDARSLGVTIEESYTVGEYDILVLSAKQSDGLFRWLNQEGYKLPKGADPILKSYIKQDMKFFVAKVNLEQQSKSGFTYLRPLQVAFESEKFMLPIRLGTLNSDSAQDIIIFTLTKNGRVEPTNYRSVKIPTDTKLPLFIENEFGEFYKAMFDDLAHKEKMKAVFLEYAWDMSWCDPCAADPLPPQDLRTLGAFWLGQQEADYKQAPGRLQSIAPQPISAVNVFVTRLHARYTAATFPEDLILHETNDRQNFQGRYIMQHPWTGTASCEAAKSYFKSLPKRFETEAQNLASITNWNISEIRKKMEESGQVIPDPPIKNPAPWWENMWKEQ